MNTADNVAFWDERAKLGEKAGTQDLILKQLERRELLYWLKELTDFSGDRLFEVLEIGCGLGETARLVTGMLKGYLTAIDSSASMIARTVAVDSQPCFMVGDAMNPPEGPWDIVYTQRCLINLPNWEAQKQAIDVIADRLVPGGRFLMCEHSQDGLDYINEIRQGWRRPKVERPWHNVYFNDSDLATVTSLKLVECVPFSATYYFLSRILNDKLAEAEGKIPQYDAKINQLALRLPYDCVDPRFAQGRLWIWEKV